MSLNDKENRPGLEGWDLSPCAAVETDAEPVAATGSAAVVTTSPVGDGNLPPLSCFITVLRGFTAGAGAALPVGVTAPG